VYVYKGRSDTTANIMTDIPNDSCWVRMATSSEVNGATRYMGVTDNHTNITGAVAGDTYFDSTDKKFYVWDGSKWDDVTVSDNSYATSAGSAGTANALTNSVNINGISFNGSGDVNNYVVCDTNAADATKEVDVNNFSINNGA